MKRTELEKRERELRRSQKKEDLLEKKVSSRGNNVGAYISDLFARFLYDDNEIFNTKDDIEILEILEEMKDQLPEKQWDNVIKKAVKKTNISERDRAVVELKELIGA